MIKNKLVLYILVNKTKSSMRSLPQCDSPSLRRMFIFYNPATKNVIIELIIAIPRCNSTSVIKDSKTASLKQD